MGVEAGRNEITNWHWDEKGNRTWLKLGTEMGIGMKHWERRGVGLKNTFPVISN